jgi:hypothetical protein
LLSKPLIVREVSTTSSTNVCNGSAVSVLLPVPATYPRIAGPRIAYHFNGVHVIEPGADNSFVTVDDNTERVLPHAPFVTFSSPVAMAGDRIAWVDSSTVTNRAMVADLADGSVRVVSTTAAANRAPSIAGDMVVFGTDELFVANTEVYASFLTVEPTLPRDRRNAAPTELRCPDDDIFEENDSTPTATRLNNGAVVNAIACRNDDDRYAIDVPRDCTVRVTASFQHADGDVDVALLDPGGAQVGLSNGSSNLESITFTPASASQAPHIVRVFGFGNAENAYDLGVTVSCP